MDSASTRNVMLPGNPRYQPRSLVPYFGYDNLMRWMADVEIATLNALAEFGVMSEEDAALLTAEMEAILREITTTEVDEVERAVTRHDVRAWVRIAQERVEAQLGRWIHVPLTSYDALDTARTLQFVRVFNDVVEPTAVAVLRLMVELVNRYANTLQIGRTHGQHALPITVGFWLATILSRVFYNLRKMQESSEGLVGKISGAVGASNAIVGLGIDAESGWSFEDEVLERVGLKPAPISTQILPPEPLAYFLFAATMLSGALGQFGRDCRQLMRTEIGELREAFSATQVGSSTMAHKRNPITFEGLEGAWAKTRNEFGKVLDTVISEHQRDLVGSSVMRDFPTILVNVQYQLERLLAQNKAGVPFLLRIEIDEEACRRNFDKSAEVILAEPLYIALQMAGYTGDAHEFTNRVVIPRAQAENRPLLGALARLAEEDPALKEVYERIPAEVKELLLHPEQYTGNAAAKAFQIADTVEEWLRAYDQERTAP